MIPNLVSMDFLERLLWAAILIFGVGMLAIGFTAGTFWRSKTLDGRR